MRSCLRIATCFCTCTRVIRLYVCMSVYVYLSVCLSVCLSAWMYVCMCVCVCQCVCVCVYETGATNRRSEPLGSHRHVRGSCPPSIRKETYHYNKLRIQPSFFIRSSVCMYDYVCMYVCRHVCMHLSGSV